MSLVYFKLDRTSMPAEVPVDDCYELCVCRPRLNSFHNIMWSIIAGVFFRYPGFLEYQYRYQGKVVAYLQVINKLPFFRYIPKGGVHTGPAYTAPEHRGHGLHPALLFHIVSDFADKDFYNAVDESNVASIKGVVRVGYKPFAIGHKAGKSYVVDKFLDK